MQKLTPPNMLARLAFPWAFSVQKALHAVQPFRFNSSNLFVGSDYAGDHKTSNYKAYSFLFSEDRNLDWELERRTVRKKFLGDGRRMSFKHLNDPAKRHALIPFLQAADSIEGHLVCFLVHKSFQFLSTYKEALGKWGGRYKLSGRWNVGAFESMSRKVHFFALCLTQWSSPGSHVTWITDEDEFVANDARLDDAQQLAAKISSIYSPHSYGIFAMNSTAIDNEGRGYEDYVAIPDLAAGMLTELRTKMGTICDYPVLKPIEINEDKLSEKSDIILDWFGFPYSSLKRTCIVIDKIGQNSVVWKLDLQDKPYLISTKRSFFI